MSIDFLIKWKEKKRNINNDLAIWPSHDIGGVIQRLTTNAGSFLTYAIYTR